MKLIDDEEYYFEDAEEENIDEDHQDVWDHDAHWDDYELQQSEYYLEKEKQESQKFDEFMKQLEIFES